MSESKGSPGPWKLVVWTVGADPGLEQRVIVDANGNPVSFRLSRAEAGTTEQANTELIVRAPEMAAMLRELEWAGDVPHCCGTPENTAACPVCGEGQEGRVHKSDCRLSALLGALP